MRRLGITACLVAAVCACGRASGGASGAGGSSTISSASSTSSSGGGLRVVKGSGSAGGQMADPSGAVVRLHGADRSGTEYACTYGQLFDGPSDQASVDAMKAWNVNAVRVPLNEDCWLGINGVASEAAGPAYQDAIRRYVTLLEDAGMYVILDLHWAAPGVELAKGQLGMADADHAPTFWKQVAAAYAADHARVMFDLFNEPFVTDWDCWLKGGACAMDASGQSYQAAGMAALLKAVRSAGADNVVLLGGLGYASDFTRWVSEVESIPTLVAPLDGLGTENVAASWHAYTFQSAITMCPSQYDGYSTSAACASGADTAKAYGVDGVLAAGYPVVLGEIGIDVDASNVSPYTVAQAQGLASWLAAMLAWADQQGVGYLAWDWSTAAGPLLITSYGGTPTPYFGVTYKGHLGAL